MFNFVFCRYLIVNDDVTRNIRKLKRAHSSKSFVKCGEPRLPGAKTPSMAGTWATGSHANWLRISLSVSSYKGILYLEHLGGGGQLKEPPCMMLSSFLFLYQLNSHLQTKIMMVLCTRFTFRLQQLLYAISIVVIVTVLTVTRREFQVGGLGEV